MKRVPPTAEGISEAAALIRAGEVVAYPTETVYGLAVDPFSAEAVRRLFQVKGRADANPVLLIAADLGQVAELAAPISTRARACMERFWPGPLSLVLPKRDCVSDALCAGSLKVCVRVPAHEVARALCAAAGHPVTSTSANRSGEAPARSAAEIDLPGVALCIDGGLLAQSAPSTVYDPDTDVVFREGAVPSALLRGM